MFTFRSSLLNRHSFHLLFDALKHERRKRAYFLSSLVGIYHYFVKSYQALRRERALQLERKLKDGS